MFILHKRLFSVLCTVTKLSFYAVHCLSSLCHTMYNVLKRFALSLDPSPGSSIRRSFTRRVERINTWTVSYLFPPSSLIYLSSSPRWPTGTDGKRCLFIHFLYCEFSVCLLMFVFSSEWPFAALPLCFIILIGPCRVTGFIFQHAPPYIIKILFVTYICNL